MKTTYLSFVLCCCCWSGMLTAAEKIWFRDDFEGPALHQRELQAPDFLICDDKTFSAHGQLLQVLRSDKTHRRALFSGLEPVPPGRDFTLAMDYFGSGYFLLLDSDKRQLGGVSILSGGRLRILSGGADLWQDTGSSCEHGEWIHLSVRFNVAEGTCILTVTSANGESKRSKPFPVAGNGLPARLQLGNTFPVGNKSFVDNIVMSYAELSTTTNRNNVRSSAEVSGQGVILRANDETESEAAFAVLKDVQGMIQFDFPAPVEISTLGLSAVGEGLAVHARAVNSGGQILTLALPDAFIPAGGGVLQAEFPSATVNSVTLELSGQVGGALGNVDIWECRKENSHAANQRFAKQLFGEFRLPVYAGNGSAGLHLFNNDSTVLPVSVILQERRSGRNIFPAASHLLQPGENRISFPLAGLAQGEYYAVVKDETPDMPVKAEFIRLLRRQITPEPVPEREPLELSGQKLFFPDAYRLEFVEGIRFRSGQTEAWPVCDRPMTDDAVLQHGETMFVKDGKLQLTFYTLDGGFRLDSKKRYHAVADLGKLSEWKIKPFDAGMSLAKPDENILEIFSRKRSGVGKPLYRYYDPARDGKIQVDQMEMKYIPFQPKGVLGYEAPEDWEGEAPPTRSTWPIWHKEPDLALILSKKPFLEDIYPGGFEEGYESNDNFAAQWLSQDQKTFFFAHGRVLRRYEPFNVPYDNLSRVSRIVTVFKTTDGVNYSQSYMALPELEEPPGTQHYGAMIFRIPQSGGLLGALVSRYFALEQRFCVDLAYSWDGFNWKRFSGEKLFLDNSPPGGWSAGCIHPSTALLESENRLYWLLNWQSSGYHFYGEFGYENFASVTGEAVEKRMRTRGLEKWPLFDHFDRDYEKLAADIRAMRITPGVMSLRKDGYFFAEAGLAGGRFVSKAIHASGHLFANIRIGEAGFLRLELLDIEGKTLPGYSAELSPGDQPAVLLLATLPEQPFKVSLEMKNAQLYTLEFKK